MGNLYIYGFCLFVKFDSGCEGSMFNGIWFEGGWWNFRMDFVKVKGMEVGIVGGLLFDYVVGECILLVVFLVVVILLECGF